MPEVARTYLEGRSAYGAEDVLEIARRQAAAEAAALSGTRGLVVLDTDLLVIRVWWEERFGALPEELIGLLAAREARAYLLARPDLPWEADPLRENPEDRQRLFDIHEALLATGAMPHRIVSGQGDARLRQAVAAARELIPAFTRSAEQGG